MKEPDSSIDQLRELLLTRERGDIADLRARLDDKDARNQELAQALPSALARSYGEGRDLRRSLQAPVTDCLREAVEQNPQTIADALFPVIGPAIRKSISEALRAFTSSLNKTLELSFSVRSLRWRFEASRSGVPFSEVVLKHTLRFWVDEVFLIQRDTGLLIEHAAHEDVSERDNDAISAMLSAIQDFVRDAFQNRDEIQEVNMGERLLWVLRGPHATLACLIRGVPDTGARAHLTEMLEQIEFKYNDALAGFSGERGSIDGLPEALKRCLIGEDLKAGEEREKKPRRWVWPLFLTAAVGLGVGIGWLQYQSMQNDAAVRDLARRLDAMPGVVVTSLSVEDGLWTVRGLRDPLEAAAPGVLRRVAIPEEKLRVIWSAYVSLEPEMVLGRARTQMRIPPAVEARLRGSVLELRGHAPGAWIDAIANASILPVGIDRIDSSHLNPTVDTELQQ